MCLEEGETGLATGVSLECVMTRQMAWALSVGLQEAAHKIFDSISPHFTLKMVVDLLLT